MRSVFWSLLDKGGQQLAAFFIFAILARLLGPAEYGVASVIFIYSFVVQVVAGGLVDGVIARQVADQRVLSSIFWLMLGIGVLAALLCLLLPVVLCILWDIGAYQSLFQQFAIVPMLISIQALPTAISMKAMDFRLLALRSLLATVVGGVVGVYSARQGQGALAIVHQQTANFLMSNLIVWWELAWRPGFTFSWQGMRAVLAPGLAQIRVGGLAWLELQLPRMLIAAIAGPVALGYYAFSARILLSVQEVFVNAPFAVLFPRLAGQQGDFAAQKKIFLQFISLVCMAAWPLVGLAVVTAPLYVVPLFGSKWSAAEPVLRLVLCGVIPTSVIAACSQAFRANGRSDLAFRYRLVFMIIATVALALLCLPQGLIVYLSVVLSVGCVAAIIMLRALARYLDFDFLEALRGLVGTTACALAGCAAAWGGMMALVDMPWWITLAVALIAGVFASVLLCSLFFRTYLSLAFQAFRQGK